MSVLVLHPYAILLVVGPRSQSLTFAGNICTILADLLLVGSALVLSFDARQTPNLAQSLMRSRMATAATLVMVQELPLSVVSVIDPTIGIHSYRLTPSILVTLVLLLAVLVKGAHGDRVPRLHPLLSGLLLGLVALAARLGVLAVDDSPFLSVGDGVDTVLLMTIAALTTAACLTLWNSPLPHWVAARLTAGIMVFFAARIWATATETSTPRPEVIVGVVLCSALLITTVIALLLGTLTATDAREESLIQRVTEAEAVVQHDLEVAHELRAATAGIVAGVRLLTHEQVPPGPRRRALEHMVDAEVARLSRATADPTRERVTTVAVDDVIAPLAVAQEALGHQVTWQPAGLLVIGRHDALAETLNILLNNAHRHAFGHATTVTSRALGDTVEIRVSDRGPGIHPDLRDRLFQWGVRGPTSMGQGIGLQRARRLMLELGGSLDLDVETTDVSTSFVCTLPSAATMTPQDPDEHDEHDEHDESSQGLRLAVQHPDHGPVGLTG